MLLGIAFMLVTLFAPKGLAGIFDWAEGIRTPDRKGAPLGPDDGSLQEKEAQE